jgi:hypothetical protein
MSAVVLIIAVASGIFATINVGELGNDKTKYDAKNLVKDKVSQIEDEKIKNACSNPVYEFKGGQHVFSCSIESSTEKIGGRKFRKSRKSKKNSKSRRLRK